MKELDGQIIGPAGFSVPIGSTLRDCEQLIVRKYNAIASNLPELLNGSDLSTEQMYLYKICQTMISHDLSINQ